MAFYMVKTVYATDKYTIIQLPFGSTAWQVREVGMNKTYKFSNGCSEIQVELPEGMHLLWIDLSEEEA